MDEVVGMRFVGEIFERTPFSHKALLQVLGAQAEKDWNPWGMSCHRKKNPSKNVLVALYKTSLIPSAISSLWLLGWVGNGRELCLNTPDDFS